MRSLLLRARSSFALGALLLAACAGGESPSVDAKPVGPTPDSRYVVQLDTRLDTLSYGGSRLFVARVTDAAGAVRLVPVDWASTNPAVVTVSAGTASAVGVGVAGLVARYGAAADTAIVVVSTAGLSLQLTPSAVAASLGDTVEFQARLVTAAGSSMAVQQVQWGVSDSSATQFVGDGRIAVIREGTLDIIAVAAGMTATASVSVAAAKVGSITISPSSASTSVGGSVRLSAVVRDQSGRILTVPSKSWRVSDASIATVDADGNVRGVSRGGVVVTASTNGKSGTATVNVAAQPAASVTLSLNPDTVVVGYPLQAVAVPRDAAGTPMSGRPVAYQSSNPGVATISNTGLIAPLAPGVTNISAICDGHIVTVQLTVRNQRVASVSIVPGAPTVAPGSAAPLIVVVADQMGQNMSGVPVTWISQAPEVATVSSTGVLTGVAFGSSQISATAGDLTATATATVSNQTVASVQVSPATTTVQAGANTMLSAVALSTTGQAVAGASFSWSSSNNAVATVSALGVVSAKAVGSALITASSGGKSAAASVTVTAAPPVPVASISVSVNAAALTIGQSTQAVATLYDAQGNVLTGRPVTWTSADPSVAGVSASGLITAVTAGSVSISAASSGRTGLAAISVAAPPPAPVASVTVTAPSSVLQAGQTSQLTVTLRDAQGNALTGRTVLYSSSNTSIAAVSPTGLVSANAGGVATITVTSEGASGNLAYSVSGAPRPFAVVVTLNSGSLAAGQTTQAVASVRDSLGNVLGGQPVTFGTSNAAVATVSGSGVVTAVAVGSAVIAASTGGIAGSATVSVTSSPSVLTGITLTPAAVSLNTGGVAQFSVAGTWSDGSTAVPVVQYSATGGTISAGGLFTAGNSAGTFRVIATQQGGTKADTSLVTIAAPAILLQLVLSPGSLTVATGGSQQFVVSGVWSNGSSTAPAVNYNVTGGTMTAGGMYAAAATPGVYRVIATTLDGARADTAAIIIAPQWLPAACQQAIYQRLVKVGSSTELSSALSRAQAGDLIVMADGTYGGHGEFRIAGASGTPTQRITLCGSKRAILDAGSLTNVDGLNIRDADYWTITGFTITNALAAIRLQHSSDNLVEGLELHQTGHVGISVNALSKRNIIRGNRIYDTGRINAEYGEGIYVGSTQDTWCTNSGCAPDATDSTVIDGNTIGPDVRAEHIDVKEGTTGGEILNNVLDGRGMVMSQAGWPASWLIIQGNGYRIHNNAGTFALLAGYKVSIHYPGWGNDNVLWANSADVRGADYGFSIQSGTAGNIVRCDNVVLNAAKGLANVACK